MRPPPPTCSSEQDRVASHRKRLRVCNRKSANRQLALANAALHSSAVGLKRSFRRPAVTRQAGNHVRCGLGGWPKPHSIFWGFTTKGTKPHEGTHG